jgi:hypothetical protein
MKSLFDVIVFFRGGETFSENERLVNVPFRAVSVEQWLSVIKLSGTAEKTRHVPSETAAGFILWET